MKRCHQPSHFPTGIEIPLEAEDRLHHMGEHPDPCIYGEEDRLSESVIDELASETPAERAAREALWWAMFHWKGSGDGASTTLPLFFAYKRAVVDALLAAKDAALAAAEDRALQYENAAQDYQNANDAKDAEIKRLTLTKDRWKHRAMESEGEVLDAQAEIAELKRKPDGGAMDRAVAAEAEIARLREALREIASPSPMSSHLQTIHRHRDIARAALGETEA